MKQRMMAITSIKSTPSLGKYLGFPLFKGRNKKEDFLFILDKMQSRLAPWKDKLLNRASRITLVKSVIPSIPIYSMQLNWIPSSICTQMDRIVRNFIWKGHSDKGIHLVSWDKVSRPKKDGGLGVRYAREANSAMLGKLVWQMHHDLQKPWVTMMHRKYVTSGDFLSCPAKQGSHVWNSIIKARSIFRDGYQFRIGSDQSLFW